MLGQERYLCSFRQYLKVEGGSESLGIDDYELEGFLTIFRVCLCWMFSLF
jgi:hypothetical protein